MHLFKVHLNKPNLTLKGNKMDYVIFAIDNNTDTHNVAKFMRHVDTQRALGAMKGLMQQAIGYWEGILEPSYIMRRDDYEKVVAGSGYVDAQECVMVAPQDTRQPAHLASYNLSEFVASLGPLREISAKEAKQAQGWTYNLASNKYFSA